MCDGADGASGFVAAHEVLWFPKVAHGPPARTTRHHGFLPAAAAADLLELLAAACLVRGVVRTELQGQWCCWLWESGPGSLERFLGHHSLF